MTETEPEPALTDEDYARGRALIARPGWVWVPKGLDLGDLVRWHRGYAHARDKIDELLPQASDPEVAEQISLLRRYQRHAERFL